MRTLPALFCLLFLLISPAVVNAVDVSIQNWPTTISSEEFTVDVVVQYASSTNTTNYLRIDLFKEGTTKYFGETFNGSEWYGGSDGKQYFPVEVQSGTGSAQIKGKIEDPLPSGYSGSGTYNLRVKRYTLGGSDGGVSDNVNIQINLATPEPSPSPSPSPSEEPSLTPTPTPDPTLASTSYKITTTPTPRGEIAGASDSAEINLATFTIDPSSSPEPEENEEEKSKTPLALAGAGLTFTAAGGTYFYQQKKKKPKIKIPD